MRNGNWCSWTNIHPEKDEMIYGTRISKPQNMGAKYSGGYEFHGARAIFLLFNDNQDTGLE